MKTAFIGVCTVAAFVYAFHRVDSARFTEAVTGAAFAPSACACMLIALSQYVSALRMRLYVKTYAPAAAVTRAEAASLYFFALFLNIFLPGGIGGDGYKCVIFHRRYGTGAGGAFRCALAERASGLYALLLLFCGAAVFGAAPAAAGFSFAASCALAGAGAVFVTLCYRAGAALLTRERARDSLAAFPYSLAVQFLQIAAFFCCCAAAGISPQTVTQAADAAAAFLFSSAAAVLPVSIGGLGLREAVFVTLAEITGEDGAKTAAAAFLFFACGLPSAAGGGLAELIKRFNNQRRQRQPREAVGKNNG